MRAGFVRVALASEVPDRRARLVRVEGEEIALWHVGDRFYAIENLCAHQHVAMLHQGILVGEAVACPMHGWTYSLETGKAVTGSGKVRTFAVVVERGEVYIEVPAPEAAA